MKNQHTAAKHTVSHEVVKHSGCAFCAIERNETNDTWVIDMNFGSLFLNYNQSYEGRAIYVPFVHYSNFNDLSIELNNDFNTEVMTISRVVQKVFDADLINIAMLSNTVNHVHWHIIPRYKNDQNWGQAPWPNTPATVSKSKMKQLVAKIKTHILIS